MEGEFREVSDIEAEHAKMAAGVQVEEQQDTRSTVCAGCGAAFQSHFLDQPGFIPVDKLGLSEDGAGLTPEPKVVRGKWAVKGEQAKVNWGQDDDADATPTKTDLDHLRCMRCYQLAHYGYTQGSLTTVKAKDFRDILEQTFKLSSRRGRKRVMLHVVDLADLEGTLVPDFDRMAGEKSKVVLVGNKVDLLPLPKTHANAGHQNLTAYVRKSCAKRVRFDAFQPISAATGVGVAELMRKVLSLAAGDMKHGTPPSDVYVVGTTNVGKSTLINRLLSMGYTLTKGVFAVDKAAHLPTPHPKGMHAARIRRLAAKEDRQGGRTASTASRLPGTTLGVVGFPLKAIRPAVLYDTPGVINPFSLLPRLTFEELDAVLSSRRIGPVSFRLTEGKSLLLGSLARIDIVASRGVFLTVVVSPHVTLHITGTEKAALVHNTQRQTPPFSDERVHEVGIGNCEGESDTHVLRGAGWMECCADVVFPGLGWVAFTGSGEIKVRTFFGTGQPSVSASGDVLPRLHSLVRPPMLPLKVRDSTRAWTGQNPRAR